MAGKQDQGIHQSSERYHVIPRTLCFVTHGGDVLLLKGAPTKRIWPNRYNGVGGHVERDEDVYSAAIREIREETGLEVEGVQLRAIINIDAGDPLTGIMLFVFTARAPHRAVRPSSEGTLEWVPRARLQEYDLVDDLKELLPRILAMEASTAPLFGRYYYDANDRLVIQWADGASIYHHQK
ncbi:MAG TPA: NUDIX domain-containing protein [Caldilineae bacterium]|jgi:8-oxo-dGTP diphosphatase|nr:NUDIX domain-containing protein [Caldilineae bacterium]